MLNNLAFYGSSIAFWIVVVYLGYIFRHRISKLIKNKPETETTKGNGIANILGILLAVVSFVLGAPLIVSAIIYLVINRFAPALIDKFLLKRKLARFDASFYETLRSLSSSLKAGLTLKDAIQVSSQSSDPVVAHELQHVLKLYQLGYSIEESLDAMRKRIPTEACNIAIGSMVISSRVGGKLPAALARIATTIKEREKIEGRLKTLTAQGRSQAALLICAPPMLACGMYFFDRSKFEILTTTTIGQILLGIAVFLEIAGIVVTNRMMKLEI